MKAWQALLLILVVFGLLSVSASKAWNPNDRTSTAPNNQKVLPSGSNSTGTHLFWLDVYGQRLPDGNTYISSDELSPILGTGARIARITFSPDGRLIWFLVEANATSQSNAMAVR